MLLRRGVRCRFASRAGRRWLHNDAAGGGGTKVVTWGIGMSGRTGQNLTWTQAPLAHGARVIDFPDMRSVVKVSGKNSHFLALTEEGDVWTWGLNATGQLGSDEGKYGLLSNQHMPFKVVGDDLPRFVDIEAGYDHSAAIDAEGNLWTWGSNYMWHLQHPGLAKGAIAPTPKQAAISNKVKQMACGYAHDVLLDTDGKVWTWGSREYGRLGCSAIGIRDVHSPQKVELAESVDQVSASKWHTLVLSNNGQLYVFGRNHSFQLGVDRHAAQGQQFDNVDVPTPLDALGVIKSVACNNKNSAAVTKEGNMYIWGGNSMQQPHLVTMPDHKKVKQVSVGCGFYYPIPFRRRPFKAADAFAVVTTEGELLLSQFCNKGTKMAPVDGWEEVSDGYIVDHVSMGNRCGVALLKEREPEPEVEEEEEEPVVEVEEEAS